jgi:hypothetical protein
MRRGRKLGAFARAEHVQERSPRFCLFVASEVPGHRLTMEHRQLHETPHPWSLAARVPSVALRGALVTARLNPGLCGEWTCQIARLMFYAHYRLGL